MIGACVFFKEECIVFILGTEHKGQFNYFVKGPKQMWCKLKKVRVALMSPPTEILESPNERGSTNMV